MKAINVFKNILSFNIKAKLIIKENGDIIDFDGVILFYLENSRFVFAIIEGLNLIINNRSVGYVINGNKLNVFDEKLKVIGYTNQFVLLYSREDNKKFVYSIPF